MDFYVAFQMSDLINFPLFCLHQGIEKLCKAYLLASQAHRYDNMPNDPQGERAVEWVDNFARSLGHDLENLLGLVSVGVKTLEPYLRDRGFVNLLIMAYEEGRYPKPPNKSIARKHGFDAQITHRNQEKAFNLGNQILLAIKRDFGISVPLEEPVPPSIDEESWERFLAIWKKACGSCDQIVSKKVQAWA